MARHTSIRPLVLAWGGLLVLTTGTLLVSFVARGGWEIASALAFALTKSVVVALIFMHLSETRGTSRLVLLTALFFVVLLISLVLGDVALRWPLAVQPPPST